MTNPIIYYVLESTFCLFIFLLVYRLLIENLTHFSWMRIYLLSSITLSLILPLLVIPVHWNSSIIPPALFNNFDFLPGNRPGEYSGTQFPDDGVINIRQRLIILFTIVYITGLFYNMYKFPGNLRSIQNCIKQNPKERDGVFWLVYPDKTVPPFSFFNYIFIADSYQSLSSDELQRIKDHEKIHAKQLHSLDVLIIEFISAVFWFNPLWIDLKKSVQEVHEYIVDEKIAERGTWKKDYARLLLVNMMLKRSFRSQSHMKPLMSLTA